MMRVGIDLRMRARRTTTLIAVAASLLAPRLARAEPPRSGDAASPAPSPAGDAAPRDELAAFPLVVPHEKHYVRAALEVGGILAVGLVDYLLNTSARGGTLRTNDARWDLRYDWPTLRDKLTGESIALDSNKFNTNYLGHPFAGTLYYSAARSNHLSFAESFLYAVMGSTTWEYFGEIRETTSVNDLVVTPVSGAAIGEATLQMAAFFDRGEKRASNDILSFLFSPWKTINEGVEDAHPLRTAHPDDLGFPTEPWHRFVASAGAGATSISPAGPTHPRAGYLDERLDLDFAIANLPGYAGAIKRSVLFDDGNVSGIRFGATTSRGALTDAQFVTRVVPAGYYFRDARIDEHGQLHGHGFVLGLRVGFEYGTHTWDRDGAFGRPNDVIALASPVGLAAEHVYDAGPLRVRTALDLYGALGGVTPYGLGEYRLTRSLDGMPTAVRLVGYYHGLSVTAAPSVELSWHRVSLAARLRFDTFRPLTGVDEDPGSVDPSLRLADTRTDTSATLAWTLPHTRVRLALDGFRHARAGDAGLVHASRTEVGARASVGVVF